MWFNRLSKLSVETNEGGSPMQYNETSQQTEYTRKEEMWMYYLEKFVSEDMAVILCKKLTDKELKQLMEELQEYQSDMRSANRT